MSGTHVTNTNGAAGPGHEPDTTSVRSVVAFAAGLVVALIVIVAAMWVVFTVFFDVRPPGDRTLHTYDPGTAKHWNDPPADLMRMRAEEDARLNSFGWVDEDAGIVHVPIEQAMHMLIEQRAGGNEEARP